MGAVGLTLSAGMAGWIEFLLLRRALQARIGSTELPRFFATKIWAAALAAGLGGWTRRAFRAPRHSLGEPRGRPGRVRRPLCGADAAAAGAAGAGVAVATARLMCSNSGVITRVCSSAAILLLSLARLRPRRSEMGQHLGLCHGRPSKGPAVAVFSFTNSGSYPVRILKTETSCGCTAAAVDQKVFAPGQKGQIHVTFKTLNRDGLYEEPIKVETDDPAGKETDPEAAHPGEECDFDRSRVSFLEGGRGPGPESDSRAVTEGYERARDGGDGG